VKGFLQGIAYNIRGVKMGLGSTRLLLLGLLRFLIMAVIAVAAATFILMKYQEILALLWQRPESMWLVWLWHLVSWVVALILVALSAVMGFVLAQLLFSIVIMDIMSQITERLSSGTVRTAHTMPWFTYFFHLLRQEIPRAILPVTISLLLLFIGWFTPAGPVLTIVAPLVAGLFLAWDNTDLVPARRMVPFGQRFAFLRSHLGFHLGFGILFLVPGLNLVLLAFAPVGATLYYIERIDPQ
jgi:CysZ protein